MQSNPVGEWQRLTEHYHAMFDGELEELAIGFADLTEMAREVLRNEMKNRGLAMPGENPAAGTRPQSAPLRFASVAVSDAVSEEPGDLDTNEEDDHPKEFTWKTPLCGCEDEAQAWQISEALRRAGIESWIARPGANHAVVWDERMVGNLQVLVAADQLDEAREIAAGPIPQDIIEDSRVDVPEYVAPSCPNCGAEDPVLESAEPANSWLCEACGKQWTEPPEDTERKPGHPVP